MAFPKVGGVAPAFTLLDQEGKKVSLKEFKGKKNVVLYFYPKAMTPGCTVQACGIRDSKNALAKIDTVVLGVSPDPVAKLGRFIENKILTLPCFLTRITPSPRNTVHGTLKNSWAASSWVCYAPPLSLARMDA
jgi:peroxiredoxin